MSRLVELYPASWRARYGEEMEWLLAERPPGPGDALDLARGALDAHLDPQLDGAPAGIRWTHRIPGVLAAAGGLAWVAWAMLMRWDAAPLVGLAFVGFVLSVLGDDLHRFRVPLARGIAALVVLMYAGMALPWPLLIAPSVAFLALAGAGLLALVAARAGIDGASRRWLVGATVVPIMSIAVVGGLLGAFESSAAAALWSLLVASYGVAWIAVGIRMVARGAETFPEITDGGVT